MNNIHHFLNVQTKLINSTFLLPDPGRTLCTPVFRLPAAGLPGAVGLPAGRAPWRSEPCQEEALSGPEGCRGPSRWGTAHTDVWCNTIFRIGAFYFSKEKEKLHLSSGWWWNLLLNYLEVKTQLGQGSFEYKLKSTLNFRKRSTELQEAASLF